jgi:predicted transcriptional regulator
MNITKKTTEDNGFNLKKALENLGMSQRKFAKLTKYNFAHINKICNGLSCSEKTAKNITDAYNKIVNKHFTRLLK